MSERAGYVIRKATKPLSEPNGLFADVQIQLHEDVIASSGGPISRDAFPEWPGEKRTHACMGAVARVLPNELWPLLLGNGV